MNRKTAATLTKPEIVAMLRAFIEQRPGMELANYGDWRAYRAESAEVTRDLHDARDLLRAVEWRDSITADHLRAELMTGGRLTLDESGRLDYCTGQYFPTEFRKAACRVLASVLWAYWRETAQPLTPTPEGRRVTGDDIRRTARRELSRRIAGRYFR